MTARDFDKCRRCKGYGWLPCACSAFECRLEDMEADDASTIWAKGDASDAAEAYLRYCYDNRDGWEWIKSDESYVVLVSKDDGEPTRWSVTASLVWRYNAEPVAVEAATAKPEPAES